MAAHESTGQGELAQDELEDHGDAAAHRLRAALILCAASVVLLLAWSTWHHIRTHMDRERALAASVTTSAVEILTRQLQEMEARLASFVNQERDALAGITASASDSPALNASLWALLQLVFPEASTALILDARSGRVVALGEGFGEGSLVHLRQFLRGAAPSVRIDGNGDYQVAEFSASWYDDGEAAGGLLIRVSCASLCRHVALSAPAGHFLSLRPGPFAEEPGPDMPRREPQLVEAAGALLAELPLSDTGWMLEDRLSEAHLYDQVYDRVILGLALGVALLLAMAALYRWVTRADRSAHRERIDLRKSQIKLQAILAATTDGIVMTDSQGRIELFNPAAEMMFGRLTEDVLKTNVFKLLPDFFSSESAGALIAQEPGGKAPPLLRETRGRRKGGKEFPVRLWVNGLRVDGEPLLLLVIQDLTENQRNEDQLVFLEQRDVLTGLYNRKELERRLTDLLAADSAGEGPHAFCYVDVDQFKLVNDTCGHEAGDELLKQIAVLFRAKLEGSEIVARVGSDEFGAVFRNLGAEAAWKICDGFMQTVRNFLFTWRDQSFDVAVSIGLIEFVPDGENASDLLSKADVACHMAKRRGRDRIHVYHEGDAELVRHQGDIRLVSAISQALSAGRFHLYAQPIVPIAGDAVRRHFEILVRMVDDGGSPVIPDDFIPAAERYILMPSVDRWIINRLFSLQAENLRAWHQTEPGSFLFAVNLSGTSVSDEGFLRFLKRQFTDWDVPHESICFEITETAAMRNLDRARAFMKELAALGCSFALDDFGTGLSSYGYLRELPVGYLKIDGSFVRGMAEDPVNYALVESINQIGHVLGLRTIAEWAEDKAIVNQLRALNVDFAQGYGVGEPMPVSDLTLADTLMLSSLSGGNSP